MAADPPLKGLRVIELAGLAPGPFCGLLLSSFGASVLRIDRASVPGAPPTADLLTSSKTSIALDLKSPASRSLLLSLIPKTDILIDPFRPGVLESLSLCPTKDLSPLNPGLITVRLTGFRRDGKYAAMAGHDINYLAVSGVLSLLGASPSLPPSPPANLLADFAGGGLTAFAGVLLALLHRGKTGKGQVVSANMVDGASYLATFPRLLLKYPSWNAPRGTNLLDGGCPFYGCYECKDRGRYMAVGALEPQFFNALLKGLGLKMEEILPQGVRERQDKKGWEFMRRKFEESFRTRTRKEWETVFDGTDACAVPVLEMGELEEEGYEQRPAVGLEVSPGKVDVGRKAWVGRPLRAGEGGEETLREWMGWKRGKDFEVMESGAWVIKEKSRL